MTKIDRDIVAEYNYTEIGERLISLRQGDETIVLNERQIKVVKVLFDTL